MNLSEKKVLVVGAGRSGIAATRFCAEQGAKVILNDQRPFETMSGPWEELKALGVLCQGGGHDSLSLSQFNYVVTSPGIPSNLPLFEQARSKGIPVIGELELAARFAEFPLIAITGTNGKSTTASLIYHLLKQGGKDVGLGGNIGTPLIEFLREKRHWEAMVVEVSSFQLETIEEFRPYVAVVLNISEDHLDRYISFEDYVQAKARIIKNQTQEDYFIFNDDDQAVNSFAASARSQKIPFSLSKKPKHGLFYDGNSVAYRDARGHTMMYPLQHVKLVGLHNIENIMAALAVCHVFSLKSSDIQKGLESFVGLEHRLEWVREYNGVSYYNDSKATNVHAVVMSLQGFADHCVFLILGGRDKGGSYNPLKSWVRKKGKRLYLIGEAREKIHRELGDLVPTVCVETIGAALTDIQSYNVKGDCVLLSPACSSYDQFNNYEERGRYFKEQVWQLH